MKKRRLTKDLKVRIGFVMEKVKQCFLNLRALATIYLQNVRKANYCTLSWKGSKGCYNCQHSIIHRGRFRVRPISRLNVPKCGTKIFNY